MNPTESYKKNNIIMFIFAFLIFLIIMIFLIMKINIFLEKSNLTNDEINKSIILEKTELNYLCEPNSYQACLALENKDDLLCNNSSNSQVCKNNYYRTLADFEQNIQYCEKTSENFKPYCKYSIAGDYNECPKTDREICKATAEYKIEEGVVSKDLNPNIDDWLLDILTINEAYKTKNAKLCDDISPLTNNHQETAICELMFAENKSGFCRKKFEEICAKK